MNKEQWKQRLTDEYNDLQTATNTNKSNIELIQQLSRKYNDSCVEFLNSKHESKTVYCVYCCDRVTDNCFVRDIYDTMDKAKAQEKYLDSIPVHKKNYTVWVTTKEVQ